MGKKQLVLCDTNILIRILRDKNEKVMKQIEMIGEENIALSVISLCELYYGALNKRELKQMKNALQGMKVLHIDEESSTLFADLMLNYSISHRLKIPDAMIAAIAITNQVLFYTENVKDFDFIPEMQLYKPK
ncbi:MAG: type II toxin-antitoxin system VapC family toxin [Bacteroidia bacterium]